jgi:hypothetical protein
MDHDKGLKKTATVLYTAKNRLKTKKTNRKPFLLQKTLSRTFLGLVSFLGF